MLANRLYKILNQYGENIVSNLQREIRINDNIATGRALESIRHTVFLDVTGGETSYILNVFGASYIKTLDEGRKPGGRSPSYNAIQKWIEAKQTFRLRDRQGRFLPKTQGNIKRAAFNISNSIKQKGTKGNNMIEYAMGPVINKVLGEVVTAFVEEELNKMIKNKTITI
jgi:hypothetical protein